MKSVLVATVLALAVAPALSAQEEIDRAAAADAYMAAYQAMDFDAMRDLLAEDAVFIDLTSLEHEDYAPGWNWRGEDDVINGVRGFGASAVEYTVESRFYGSGVSVFVGTADAVYPMEEGALRFRFPIVTAITVDSRGLVTEHRDYTDYDGAYQVGAGEE